MKRLFKELFVFKLKAQIWWNISY